MLFIWLHHVSPAVCSVSWNRDVVGIHNGDDVWGWGGFAGDQEGYLLLGSSGMCRASLSASLPGCALCVEMCEQNFGQRWFYKDNLSKFNFQPWVVSLWDGKFRIADAPSISGVCWWWGGSHGESPDFWGCGCLLFPKLEMLCNDKRKKSCNSVKMVR